MFLRLSHFSLVFLLIGTLGLSPANADDLRFAGDKTDRTDVFTMDGPWLLDWSARSPSRLPCNYQIWSKDGSSGLPCNIELRLVDARSGDYLGTIAQLEGEGRGYKLFGDAGTYRIEVVSQHVNWELLVKPISEERAARLRGMTEKGPTLEDRSTAVARQVPDDAFTSWRPVDDTTLLLFTEDDSTGFRVTFAGGCTGLAKVKTLSFVSASSAGGIDHYDSILLDDGTRCYFDRVYPTILD